MPGSPYPFFTEENYSAWQWKFQVVIYSTIHSQLKCVVFMGLLSAGSRESFYLQDYYAKCNYVNFNVCLTLEEIPNILD